MTPKKASTGAVADREIITTRVFAYPRELMFKAWTDPSHLKNWWGPKGFRNTFKTFDLRPGGAWEFIMHGPDGTDYDNKVIFEEITEPSRIVMRHLDPQHEFQVTATFEEMKASQTRLTFRMLFIDAAECQRIKAFVTEANEQNFDRLEAELATM